MDIAKNKFLFSILFLIVFISLIGNVVAQPPFQVQPPLIQGYFIEIPEQGVFKAGADFTFFFHVFNLSTGFPLTNDSINCEFNLHNSSSTLIHSDTNLKFDVTTTAFFSEVKGGNFSKVGDYTYVTHCNGAALGGVVSVEVIATQTGKLLDEPQGLVILGLFLVLILLTWAFLYFGSEVEYVPFKIFLTSLGALMLMFTVGVSLNIVQDMLLMTAVLSGMFVGLYRLMLILVSAGGIGLMLYIIYMSVRQFYSNRGLINEEIN